MKHDSGGIMENQWQDLKVAVYWPSPSSLTELEQYCQKEMSHIKMCKANKKNILARLANITLAKGDL